MCTRKQAIEHVVNNKRGSKKELRRKIGHFYESFLMLGIIQEVLPDPDSYASSSDSWAVTDIAIQNAVLYGIKIE